MVTVKRVYSLYFERPLEKTFRTVLVSQNTLENNEPRAGALHKQLSIKIVSLRWLVSVVRGPIRRNRSNRLRTGPAHDLTISIVTVLNN